MGISMRHAAEYRRSWTCASFPDAGVFRCQAGSKRSIHAADGIVRARNSHLALPHSRLNFAGSLQNGLKLELVSQDLRDLFAAIPARLRQLS
jgi:hypothetical protein